MASTGGSPLSIDEAWDKLFPVIESVLQTEHVSVESYVSAYSCVHDAIAWSSSGSSVSSELYDRLVSVFQQYCSDSNIIIESSSNIINVLADEWSKAAKAIQVLDSLFNYLNRWYIPFAGCQPVKSILELKWRQTLLSPISADVIDKFVQAYLTIDRGAPSLSGKTLTTLATTFRREIIASAPVPQYSELEQAVYTAVCNLMTTEMERCESLTELAEVLERFIECEVSLASDVLLSFSDVIIRRRLLSVCADYVISKLPATGDINLLDCNTLGIIFKLLKMTETEAQNELDDGRSTFFSRREFLDSLATYFSTVVSELLKIDLDVTNVANSKELHQFLPNRALKIHDRVSEFCKLHFPGGSIFVASAEAAFRRTLNSSILFNSFSSSPAAFTSEFADLVINTSTLNEAQPQLTLLARLLEDVDELRHYLELHISYRLLRRNSERNLEEESDLLAVWKKMFGVEFVSRMRRMVSDSAQSRQLSESCPLPRPFTCSYSMLGYGTWQHLNKCPTLTLPPTLQEMENEFTKLYTSQFSNRNVKWLHHFDTFELRFNTSAPQPYLLLTSSAQAVILLAFNSVPSRTVEDLEQESGLTVSVVQTLLKTLSEKIGVLKYVDGAYQSNLSFKSKKRKLTLNPPKRTLANRKKDIDLDRGLVVEAGIVRVMKARQTLNHRDLFQETAETLLSRFPLTQTMFKKSLENLITRDFLERTDEETYVYIS